MDLYLVHSPMVRARECGKDVANGNPFPVLQFVKEMGLGKAWREMERLQTEGKARSIGVSNYRIVDLEETSKTANVSQDSDVPSHALTMTVIQIVNSVNQVRNPFSHTSFHI